MVQSVGTDGQLFQFMVFQLNTTDLVSSDGIKNLVWIDSDQNLYEQAQCAPEVKKRVVTVSEAWGMVLETLPSHLCWGFGSGCGAAARVLNELKGLTQALGSLLFRQVLLVGCW